MQLHSDIKPISWLKNNAKQLIASVAETGKPHGHYPKRRGEGRGDERPGR
ncbi:MAG: hypothetical protein PWQ57_859 [Desulfovibrionales bacterium]|nr:hypothetical protein [Desulfovibrionales bacterium]